MNFPSATLYERLMLIPALPRGERLASYVENFTAMEGYPLWYNLIDQSQILSAIEERNKELTKTEEAAIWRHYAAPLRKAREKIKLFDEQRKFNLNLAFSK